MVDFCAHHKLSLLNWSNILGVGVCMGGADALLGLTGLAIWVCLAVVWIVANGKVRNIKQLFLYVLAISIIVAFANI